MAKTSAAPKQYDPMKDGVPKKPVGLYFIGGMLLVALIVGIGIAIAVGNSDDEQGQDDAVDFRPVEISGATVETFPDDAQGILDPASDPTVGTTVPTVDGQTFTGEDVTVGANGDPQIILFVAHWCPHCQAEVPRIVDYMNSGLIPETISVNAVSTAVNEPQGNYPPASWLEREDWPNPVLADDASGSASNAYGLRGFPYFVAIDGEGQIVMRGSGELNEADVTRIVAALEVTAT